MDKRPPELDMTPDGGFAPPRRTGLAGLPWPTRVALAALGVAVLGGMLLVAALFLWLALWLIPVVLVAGLVGWVSLRFQLWRATRRAGAGRSVSRQNRRF